VNERLEAISGLLNNGLFTTFQGVLKGLPDAERIVGRIALHTAKPRDLLSLGGFLHKLPAIHRHLQTADVALLQQLAKAASPLDQIAELLTLAIDPEPAPHLRDGGVIANGFDTELDELRALSQGADALLLQIEQQERERTGNERLKGGYNRVHGYYIEISRARDTVIPEDYQRRQTLKGAERYITPELKEIEEKVLHAQEHALAREKVLYALLLETLNEDLLSIRQRCDAIAQLDVLVSLADCAHQYQWCRPQLSDKTEIQLEEARHPVVETQQNVPFVPNGVSLQQDQRMLLITGPNMGGKSTYMRQTALIVIMAHIGSYVPAKSAVIGKIDRIFTRIGATDDLASGRSTFMIEMIETADILNNATEQSLVIMDEIGRGTSTYDGLSLAQAAATHIAEKTQSLCLFATHYFELTALPQQYSTIENAHLDAVEHDEEIVFLHKVKSGAANRSYGIQVAALAGVPRVVLQQAKEILATLEQNREQNHTHDQVTEGAKNALSMENSATVELAITKTPDNLRKIQQQLQTIDPDNLTPREALSALYKLIELVK
jgi:DNA mismatch repair protein MutS